jgi:UPF0716 protein FxsA
MVKWFLLPVAALLFAEVAAFLAVGAVIGGVQALLLLLTTSLLGLVVLQYPGRARISRLHDAVTKNGIPGLQAGGDAFLTVAAGFLLLLPGFITDAVGLLLLLPPVRGWIGGRFRRHVRTHPPGRPGVVDLERDQWDRMPERRIDERQQPDGTP